jgi:hypothetical protein
MHPLYMRMERSGVEREHKMKPAIDIEASPLTRLTQTTEGERAASARASGSTATREGSRSGVPPRGEPPNPTPPAEEPPVPPAEKPPFGEPHEKLPVEYFYAGWPGVPVEREQGSRFDDGRSTLRSKLLAIQQTFSPEHRHLGSAPVVQRLLTR